MGSSIHQVIPKKRAHIDDMVIYVSKPIDNMQYIYIYNIIILLMQVKT